MVAAVAVVGLLFAGEPTLALPNIANAFFLLQIGHPRVDANQYGQTNHPLDGQDDQVNPAEQDKPKQTSGVGNTGELYFITTALGTLNIQ